MAADEETRAETLSDADPESNRVYDYLEQQFGREDPRSSGYRSVRSFEFEADVIRNVLRRYEGIVLDVACGHGLVSGPLIAQGRRVFGIDFNRTAISSAASKGLIAVRGDAFSMPFNKRSFDIVLLTEFIQQYNPEQSNRLIKELVRVIRPGGVLILIWRNGTSLMRRLITNTLKVVDLIRRRPALKLFDHHFSTVRGWGGKRGMDLISSLCICPVLRLTIPEAASFRSRLLGTSYLAVMRRNSANTRS